MRWPGALVPLAARLSMMVCALACLILALVLSATGVTERPVLIACLVANCLTLLVLVSYVRDDLTRDAMLGDGDDRSERARTLDQILADMRENQRRLEELALFNHPDLQGAWEDVVLTPVGEPAREWCPRCLTSAQLRYPLSSGLGSFTYCPRCDDRPLGEASP